MKRTEQLLPQPSEPLTLYVLDVSCLGYNTETLSHFQAITYIAFSTVHQTTLGSVLKFSRWHIFITHLLICSKACHNVISVMIKLRTNDN